MSNLTLPQTRNIWIGLWLGTAILLATSNCLWAQSPAGPIKVELRESNGNWQLFRAGKPYFVRGAGGTGSLELLAECGGNSNRTWGADEEIRERLDEAHRLGITVAVGIWLEHAGPNFDYNRLDSVSTQIDQVLAAVRRFKDHPAVLLWGIGNEMEGAQGDNPAIWSHIEHLARLVKAEDPNHPTMSVIAEIGGRKVEAIHKLCPSLDLIGINSYGGAASLADQYRKAGGQKPYLVTEFGPVGTWEVPKNSFGAIVEPSSTDKANVYQTVYNNIVADKSHCLGSYAFLWGHKQEGTATWFGLLLPNGNKTSAVDVLTEAWSGKPPENRCPKIENLTVVDAPSVLMPGAKLNLELKASDPEGKPISVQWRLLAEADAYVTGGFFQQTPQEFPDLFSPANQPVTELTMPDQAGIYRIYATVDDGSLASATANVVVQVQGSSRPIAGEPATMTGESKKTSDGAPAMKAPMAKLPLVVFDEVGTASPFAPSGWMGNAQAMELKPDCSLNPFAGSVCLQCDFKLTSDWGGVVWQNPANDWGDLAGGFDLTPAKKLTFQAKGSVGGEKVTFGVGLIATDKPFYDTTKKEQVVTLTDSWQEYSIDLTAADLSRIKSGFWFSVAGQSKPLRFYLDEIQFVGE